MDANHGRFVRKKKRGSKRLKIIVLERCWEFHGRSCSPQYSRNNTGTADTFEKAKISIFRACTMNSVKLNWSNSDSQMVQEKKRKTMAKLARQHYILEGSKWNKTSGGRILFVSAANHRLHRKAMSAMWHDMSNIRSDLNKTGNKIKSS